MSVRLEVEAASLADALAVLWTVAPTEPGGPAEPPPQPVEPTSWYTDARALGRNMGDPELWGVLWYVTHGLAGPADPGEYNAWRKPLWECLERFAPR